MSLLNDTGNIFQLTERISKVLNEDNIDTEKLLKDIKNTYTKLPQLIKTDIHRDTDKIIEILQWYQDNGIDSIGTEDIDSINNLTWSIVTKISSNSKTNICDEDINELFEQKEDDIIQFPDIDVLTIKYKLYKYDNVKKEFGIQFETVKMKGVKLYAHSNNRYIINNVFSMNKDKIDKMFNSNFFRDQYDYIDNLDEKSKILLYTYTTTLGILIIKQYKMFQSDPKYQFNIGNILYQLRNNVPIYNVPLIHILIEYLEEKQITLDYNDIAKSVLDIISDENKFTQDDIKNVFEIYISTLTGIINNAPKINDIVLYKGIKEREDFISSDSSQINNSLKSFSLIPHISWEFVSEIINNNNLEKNFCYMIKATLKEDVPVLFVSIISSTREQYEILVSNIVKFVSIKESIESCAFNTKVFNVDIDHCSVYDLDCDKIVNDIKHWFGETIKNQICDQKCNINVINVDVISNAY